MRIRIIIKKNEADPAMDLALAASLRRALYGFSPVEIDPDDERFKTLRLPQSREAYIEFDTKYPEEVDRVIAEHNFTNFVSIQKNAESFDYQAVP